jgi:hypothetical protein
MSFSLKWLFVLVAIAALFAAAFNYQTQWWSISAVTLTLIILIAAACGLSLGLLAKPFWFPFVITGWTYCAVAFFGASVTDLPLSLPTTRLAYEMWQNAHSSEVTQILNTTAFDESSVYAILAGHTIDSGWNISVSLGFREYLRLFHSLSALIFAALAGVIASCCVRRAAKRSEC